VSKKREFLFLPINARTGDFEVVETCSHEISKMKGKDDYGPCWSKAQYREYRWGNFPPTRGYNEKKLTRPRGGNFRLEKEVRLPFENQVFAENLALCSPTGRGGGGGGEKKIKKTDLENLSERCEGRMGISSENDYFFRKDKKETKAFAGCSQPVRKVVWSQKKGLAGDISLLSFEKWRGTTFGGPMAGCPPKAASRYLPERRRLIY